MGAIYLNLPRRVEAIGYVFILALMIASPSVQTILEVLDRIVLVIFNNTRIFPDDIDQEALDIVRWIGFQPKKIYLGICAS